jgi:hypothetical protein
MGKAVGVLLESSLLVCAALVGAGCSASSSGAAPGDGGADAANDSTPEAAPDAPATDASAEASPDAPAPAFLGATTLFELANATSTTLALAVSFRTPAPHAYDDRQGGIGCTADHYDAVSKPVPHDANAGLLRVSGFAGGTTLSGDVAADPIGCLLSGPYYACTYPARAPAFEAAFAPGASPLGPGPIAFAGNGGADFAAVYVAGSPDDGTLSVAEDLTAIRYDPAQNTVLHPTCSSACPSARIAVEVTAFPSSSAAGGWPYASVGAVRCVFAAATSVAVPSGAIAAALASDARLDSVRTAVVRLPPAALVATDLAGNVLTADVGRGVFGVAPRAGRPDAGP